MLVVGNNWDGTADVVDPYTFKPLTRLNIVPDRAQREAEIFSSPVSLGYYFAIRELVGEGNHQYVDDAFTSHDGRYLYVSRPSFADVVGIDLTTRKIAWRTKIAGNRADHMAISPDGERLLVSASTANTVHAIDTKTGRILGGFESGDTPHESNYSADGSRIFHASIGFVYTPADEPLLDSTKGKRYFQIHDAKTLRMLRRVDMGQKLAQAGYPGMSSAVRPMAISPDEKRAYLQISFLHGFVEYDIETTRSCGSRELPVSDEAKGLRREQYLLDSAHHGIAITPDGKKLCVAGHDVRLRGGRLDGDLQQPDRRPRQEAVLGDQQRRWPLLLRLAQRRRPRRRDLLRRRERDREHPASAITRSGCGWARCAAPTSQAGSTAARQSSRS